MTEATTALTAKRSRAADMRRYRARRKAALAADRAIREREKTGTWPATAAGVCAWAESELKVPTGPLQGQKVLLQPFQREFIEAVCDGSFRTVSLSIARKNGKSVTASIICLAYLCGPMNRPRWRGLVCSLTGKLAAEIREMIRQLSESSPDLQAAIDIRAGPAPGHVLGLRGSRLDILASDKATGVAVGGQLALYDELALIPEAKRGMVASVFNALSAADGKFVAISIRGPGKAAGFPFLDEREEAHQRRPDRHWWREYRALDPACELTDRAAWAQANPGLGTIKSEAFMADAADDAVNNEIPFRSEMLNQQVMPERNAVVPLAAWQDCVRVDAEPPTGEVVIGWDQGGSVSLTSCAVLSVETGNLWIRAACSAEPPLSQRGRADGVGDTYVDCFQRKELKVYPGRGGVPVRQFLADCLTELYELTGGNFRVVGAGADRYRQAEAGPVLAKLGCPIVWRGVGTGMDGSYDIRAFQAQVGGESIRISPRWSRLLTFAIGLSELRYDANGNPALERGKSTARIDPLSATVIASGLVARLREDSGESQVSQIQVSA